MTMSREQQRALLERLRKVPMEDWSLTEFGVRTYFEIAGPIRVELRQGGGVEISNRFFYGDPEFANEILRMRVKIEKSLDEGLLEEVIKG